MTVINDTMTGILDALHGGGWVHYEDVNLAVVAAGGNTRRIADATKRLRDMGFPIVVDQRRHLTQWQLRPNDVEQAAQHDRILRDAYSELLSYWKALTGAQATAPTLATYRALADVETAVISMGRAQGKSLNDIVAEMAVTPNTTGYVLTP